jgi:hypothetical protein
VPSGRYEQEAALSEIDLVDESKIAVTAVLAQDLAGRRERLVTGGRSGRVRGVRLARGPAPEAAAPRGGAAAAALTARRRAVGRASARGSQVAAAATVGPLRRTRLAHRAYARGAYSTLLNGQSDASQSLTARQRGTSSSAWLARTQESARASSSPSGGG